MNLYYSPVLTSSSAAGLSSLFHILCWLGSGWSTQGKKLFIQPPQWSFLDLHWLNSLCKSRMSLLGEETQEGSIEYGISLLCWSCPPPGLDIPPVLPSPVQKHSFHATWCITDLFQWPQFWIWHQHDGIGLPASAANSRVIASMFYSYGLVFLLLNPEREIK